MCLDNNVEKKTDNEIIWQAVSILSERFWKDNGENVLFPVPVLTLEEARKIIINDFIAKCDDALYVWEYAKHTRCWVNDRVIGMLRNNILHIQES